PVAGPLPSREVVTVSPTKTTSDGRMQGDLPERTVHRLDELCHDATPDVARARECRPVPECVPVSYPRGLIARQQRQHYMPTCRYFMSKPSDGLEVPARERTCSL